MSFISNPPDLSKYMTKVTGYASQSGIVSVRTSGTPAWRFLRFALTGDPEKVMFILRRGARQNSNKAYLAITRGDEHGQIFHPYLGESQIYANWSIDTVVVDRPPEGWELVYYACDTESYDPNDPTSTQVEVISIS